MEKAARVILDQIGHPQPMRRPGQVSIIFQESTAWIRVRDQTLIHNFSVIHPLDY